MPANKEQSGTQNNKSKNGDNGDGHVPERWALPLPILRLFFTALITTIGSIGGLLVLGDLDHGFMNDKYKLNTIGFYLKYPISHEKLFKAFILLFLC